MNRKLLTTRLNILHKNLILLFTWKSFWMAVETQINKTNKLKFSDKLFPHQGKFFHLSNFIRRPVVLPGEFVPLDWFSQTRCLRELIHSIDFLRQTVTILGELVPHETFSQTSGLNPLNRVFFSIQSVSKMKENDWQRLQYLFFWLTFLFMVVKISVYGQYFLSFATVKLIQSVRLFQTILSTS